MKKKLLAGLFFVLAASFVAGGFSAGGGGILGGIVLALVFVALGLKQLGVIGSKGKKNGKTGKYGTEATVWATSDGDVYHAYSICQYLYGKKAICLGRSEAKAKGLRPCKKCYPYGD